MYDVIIIGGGLSGLITARLLALNNLSVVVIEKNHYPFHRVCGEYISNEVKPFLQHIDCFPSHLQPTEINTLEITAPSGFKLNIALPLGGFGISRYAYDDFLKEKVREAGAEIIEGEQVASILEEPEGMVCTTQSHKIFRSKVVLGAQGKRSIIDKHFNRAFIEKRSPYIGVKYHIEIDRPENLIALHNFSQGYCGISKIENNRYCLCYLTTRENLRQHGSIVAMEKAILYQNPYLKSIFAEAKFLFEAPIVINEISFAPKTTREGNVLFCGDAAGMIAPLCGNGMAMAIHSAKLLSESILKHYTFNSPNINTIHSSYQKEWNRNFKQRLWIGRTIQKLFGENALTELSLRTLSLSPALLRFLIKQTHGKTLKI